MAFYEVAVIGVHQPHGRRKIRRRLRMQPGAADRRLCSEFGDQIGDLRRGVIKPCGFYAAGRFDELIGQYYGRSTFSICKAFLAVLGNLVDLTPQKVQAATADI